MQIMTNYEHLHQNGNTFYCFTYDLWYMNYQEIFKKNNTDYQRDIIKPIRRYKLTTPWPKKTISKDKKKLLYIKYGIKN